MINLIQLLVLVSICQSMFLTPEDNSDRLKKCGIQNNSTTGLPRVQARDAPWLITMQIEGESSPAVLISPNVAVVTGLAVWVFNTSQLQTTESWITASCKKETDLLTHVTFEFFEKVCATDECSKQQNGAMNQPDMVTSLGNCSSLNSTLLVFHFKTPFQNAPICLPNRRKPVAGESVMFHSMSHFSGIESEDMYTEETLETEEDPRWIGNKKRLLKVKSEVPPIIARQNKDQLELVGITAPLFYSSNMSNQYLNVQLYEKDICQATGVCPPVPSLTEINGLTEEENEQRAETCGIPASNTSTTPLSIARNAPWVVGVETSHTNLTGLLISKRHVLVDGRLFDDQDLAKLLVNTPKLLITYLSYNPNSEFFVNVHVEECAEEKCDTTEKKDVMASKIVYWNEKHSYAVLELSSSVSAAPICLTDVTHKKGDVAIQQDYRLPEKLMDEVTISSNESWIRTNGSNRVNSSSEVLVRKINDRYFAYGLRSSYSLSDTSFKSIPLIYGALCGQIKCKEKVEDTVPSLASKLTLVPFPRIPTAELPVELSKLTVKENKERWESCGLTRQKTLLFARDTPWIVRIVTKDSDGSFDNSTGFLISKRHVLVDKQLFRGKNLTMLFGNDRIRRLPTDKTDPFFVEIFLAICADDDCDFKMVLLERPKKIAINTDFFILELAKDLKTIGTACIAESNITKTGDEVITLNFNSSLSQVYKVGKTSSNGEIYVKKPWSKDSSRQVMIQRINGNRMTAVGFSPEMEYGDTTKWQGIGAISEAICNMTGVCPKVPIRETLPPRVRGASLRDEFPDHPEFKDPIGEDYVEEDDEDELSRSREYELFLVFWGLVSWALLFLQ